MSYVWQKGNLVGPPLKIPFMGPFLDSIYPKFSNYKRQWASGELSCVSVFHKYAPLVIPPFPGLPFAGFSFPARPHVTQH